MLIVTGSLTRRSYLWLLFLQSGQGAQPPLNHRFNHSEYAHISLVTMICWHQKSTPIPIQFLYRPAEICFEGNAHFENWGTHEQTEPHPRYPLRYCLTPSHLKRVRLEHLTDSARPRQCGLPLVLLHHMLVHAMPPRYRSTNRDVYSRIFAGCLWLEISHQGSFHRAWIFLTAWPALSLALVHSMMRLLEKCWQFAAPSYLSMLESGIKKMKGLLLPTVSHCSHDQAVQIVFVVLSGTNPKFPLF